MNNKKIKKIADVTDVVCKLKWTPHTTDDNQLIKGYWQLQISYKLPDGVYDNAYLRIAESTSDELMWIFPHSQADDNYTVKDVGRIVLILKKKNDVILTEIREMRRALLLVRMDSWSTI